jgi:hypothetical protein
MIKSGTLIKVYSFRKFKDDPSKDVGVETSENAFGVYQAFQTLDINGNPEMPRRTGFAYVHVHNTNVPLKVGDTVTVKKIIYFQRHGNYCTIGIEIEETAPLSFSEEEVENDISQSNDLDIINDIAVD